MSHPGPDSEGATRAQATRRRPWWLWALVALLALAILLFGLAQCGNDPDPASTATPAPSSAPTGTPNAAATPGDAGGAATPGAATEASGPAAGAGAGAAGTGQGSLTADGTSLLPVAQVTGPNGALNSQAGKTATAQGVLVQSVPADEGFWVGTNETDRVWVQLSGTNESGYVVQQGDRVDFTGQVTAHDSGFAVRVGVDAAEGAEQLSQQGAHIEVAKSALRRSPT